MISTKGKAIRLYCDKVCPTAQPRGSCVIESVSLHRDADGTVTYKHDIASDTNLSDYINSFEAGASLKSMLQRCAFMPTREKIMMFQQQEQGLSADLSNMPTDFTSAYLHMKKVSKEHPEFVKSVQSGASFADALKHFFPKQKSNNNSEVTPNGKIQSSAE